MVQRARTFFACVALAGLAASGLAGADAGAGDTRYYSRGEEGWFWYVDPEALIKAPSPLPPPANGGGNQPPADLSTAWLRANIDQFRDRAIDSPTPENVSLFLYLQRLAMDRAERFASAAQLAMQMDPELDGTTRRPVASYAGRVGLNAAESAAKAVVATIAKTAGIWFFYRADCTYCHAQAPVLNWFADRYGFAVHAISLDGLPMPDGSFPEFAVDSGQAAKLGVVATPAMFVVRPPGDVLPISQGALAGQELVERVLTIAHSAGWITPAQYAETRIFRPGSMTEGLPASLASMANDPARLLAALRSSARPTSRATPVDSQSLPP